MKQFWSDIDEILEDEKLEQNILDAIPEEKDKVSVSLEKGDMNDIPDNLVNALTAVVPTVDQSGSRNLKIFIYKNDKDNNTTKIKQTTPQPYHTQVTQCPLGRIDYATRIAKLTEANKIASNNLYDTGGETIPLK